MIILILLKRNLIIDTFIIKSMSYWDKLKNAGNNLVQWGGKTLSPPPETDQF